MSRIQLIRALALACTLGAATYAGAAEADSVAIYPAPSYLTRSTTYTVTVNGQQAPVLADGARSYVHFGFAGTAEVVVTVSQTVQTYRLSPLSAGLTPGVQGTRMTIRLDAPRKLILHKVNSLSEKLFILADPLEDDAPRLADASTVNIMRYGVDSTGATDAVAKIEQALGELSGTGKVLYFPPGVYRINTALDVRAAASNTSIYLAPGAVIRAGGRSGRGMVDINGATNFRVFGRGSIDANKTSGKMVWAEPATKLTIEGILFQRLSGDFHLRLNSVTDLLIDNVKLVGETAASGNDGMDPKDAINVRINDCFIYSGDDPHSLGTSAGRVHEYSNMTNCVLWNNGSGAGLKTFSLSGPTRHMTYENLDVVSAPRGVSFCAVGGGSLEDIWLKNVRIEEIRTTTVIDLKCPTSDPWGSSDAAFIKDFYVQSMDALMFGSSSSPISGRDSEHLVENATFDGLRIAGQPRASAQDARFSVNQFVRNLQFTNTGRPVVGIRSLDQYAAGADNTAEFEVRRASGASDSRLTVGLRVRGTASRGVDYTGVPDSVTIPAGEQAVRVRVSVAAGARFDGLRTAHVALKNIERSAAFMIGPEYHAQVSLRAAGTTATIRRAALGTAALSAPRVDIMCAGGRTTGLHQQTLACYDLRGSRIAPVGRARTGETAGAAGVVVRTTGR